MRMPTACAPSPDTPSSADIDAAGYHHTPMELILVRHGQARFGTDDYDRLSSLGREQMQHLADHLCQLPDQPRQLVHGTLQRQRESAELLCRAFDRKGASLRTRSDPRLNEYDIAGVFWGYLDDVIAARPELAPYRNHLNDNPEVFETVYRGVMHAWLADGQPDSRGLQSWGGFQSRVQEALTTLEGPGKDDDTALLVTSGAVVASLVGQALELDAHGILALNRELYNSSVSRLRLADGGMTLTMFNAVPHLEAAEADRLLTRR